MRLDIKKVLRRVREEIGYPEGAYLFLDELRENLKRKVTAKELAVEFFKTKLNLMDNPNFNEMEKKEIHIYRRYATILLIHLIEEEGEEEFADKLHDIFFREFEFTFMTNLGMERMDGTIEANISADWIANMIVREQRKKGLYADNPMIDADINEEIEQKKREIREEIDQHLETYGVAEIKLDNYLKSAKSEDYVRILPKQLIAVKYSDNNRILWEK